MAGVTLYDYQLDAINRMKIGCILCGGVGSGKSRTSLAFYYKLYDGEVNTENYVRMIEPPDLYIITTARKRDTGEWDEELAHFYILIKPNATLRDVVELCMNGDISYADAREWCMENDISLGQFDRWLYGALRKSDNPARVKPKEPWPYRVVAGINRVLEILLNSILEDFI